MLAFLVPLLQDLNQLLRRESETSGQVELGCLVDNVLHVFERTQDVLLERVTIHVHEMRQRSMKMMYTVAEGSASPFHGTPIVAATEVGRRELDSVWTLVEILLVMNAWIVLFRPAYVTYREKEREKELARRGYLGLLGSAAVGVVKGAAGVVSHATNVTYKVIHDAFDMIGEPNAAPPTPGPIAPTATQNEEGAGHENELILFTQILLRICACFDGPNVAANPASDVGSNDPANVVPPPDVSGINLVSHLFSSDNGQQATQILTFLLKSDRPYGHQLASQVRKTMPPSTSSSTLGSSASATPMIHPSPLPTPIGFWNSSPHPSPMTGLASPALSASPNPITPAPLKAMTQEADTLMHLYTIMCIVLDATPNGDVDSSASDASSLVGVESGEPGEATSVSASIATPIASFVFELGRAVHQLHEESSRVMMLTQTGSPTVEIGRPPMPITFGTGGGTERKFAVSGEIANTTSSHTSPRSSNNIPHTHNKPPLPTISIGSSISSSSPTIGSVTLSPFIPSHPPNPSAAYLPPLPPLPELTDPSIPSSSIDTARLVDSMLVNPAWLDLLETVRPMTHPLLEVESFHLATRLAHLRRVGVTVRDAHARYMSEQVGMLQDALAMVAALSTKHAAQESTRYTDMQKKRTRMARRRLTTWKWLLRSLTNERGPWSQTPTPTAGSGANESTHTKRDGGGGGQKLFWKLDEVESSSRMRMKLKVNYAGHDHKESAHDYVATKTVSIGETRLQPSSATSSLFNTPSSSSSSSTLVPGDDDQFAAAILFSKSAQGVLSPEWQMDRRVTMTEPEDDWEQLEGGKGGKNEKASKTPLVPTNEAVFDVECSLIHPTDVVGGRLRANATHLHFEARDDVTSIGLGDTRDRERRRKLHAKRRGGGGVIAPNGHGVFFEAMQDRSWNLSHVVALHFRRHQLRRNAIELFFQDHTCVFFVFANEVTRNNIHAKLLRALRPYARIQQQRLVAACGVSTGGVVSPLAHMSFVFAGSSGNYGIGGPWGGNAFDVIRKSGLVTAWRQRKISNFLYLQLLNTIAGRTYNDLTQYPVFPWVLADYTSPALNLDDPTNESGVFRDLTKPVGALNPDRLRMFLDRYRSLDDPSMPPFMYGTHYSSAGSVLHYLMRLEPFTTASVELQDGKFDHSDRLFHSIPATWHGVTSNAADVKELIPEFFYLPEMFLNLSNIDFGTKQHGEKIGDVILPPWAKDAHDFVRIHRAALESEYVSLNLHHWIDLIFGFKQQGRAAVDASNVFFHLTYEGGVDIERIEDPTVREATIAQIEHFGQTPSQLFTSPHLPRISAQEHAEYVVPSIFAQLREYQKLQLQSLHHPHRHIHPHHRGLVSPGGVTSTDSAFDLSRGLMLQLYNVEQVAALAATENPLLFLALLPGSDRLLSVSLDRVMGLHKFKNRVHESLPPLLMIDKRKHSSTASLSSSSSHTWNGVTGSVSSMGSVSSSGSSTLTSALNFMGGRQSNAGSGKRVGVHFTVNMNILPFLFLRSHDERFLLSAGHWDNSLRVTHIDSGIGIQAISAHKDIVTCVAISEVGDYIVTGSRDTTTIVWQVAEYVIDLVSHPMFTAMGAAGPAAATATASAAQAGDLYLLDTPLHVLYGHDDEVLCVAVSSDLDTVVSASRDGTIMLHTLRSGRYTRTITPLDLHPIRWVGISAQGTVMAYSPVDFILHAFTINGDVIGSCDTGERLSAFQWSADGEFLLTGGERKQLSIYQLYPPATNGNSSPPLQCVHRLPPTDTNIRCIALTHEEQHILVGTASGKLYVYGLNSDYVKKRLLRRLENAGLYV